MGKGDGSYTLSHSDLLKRKWGIRNTHTDFCCDTTGERGREKTRTVCRVKRERIPLSVVGERRAGGEMCVCVCLPVSRFHARLRLMQGLRLLHTRPRKERRVGNSSLQPSTSTRAAQDSANACILRLALSVLLLMLLRSLRVFERRSD